MANREEGSRTLKYKTEVHRLGVDYELVIYRNEMGQAFEATIRSIKGGNAVRFPIGLLAEAIKLITP